MDSARPRRRGVEVTEHRDAAWIRDDDDDDANDDDDGNDDGNDDDDDDDPYGGFVTIP